METLQLTETTSEVSVFALQLDAGLDDGAASFYVADHEFRGTSEVNHCQP